MRLARALPLILILALGPPLSAAGQAQPPAPAADANVRATILSGVAPAPAEARPVVRPGDVTLNFPALDVRDAARAVLGETLGLAYAVAPSASGRVSVVTAEPVARADVLVVFEDALRSAGLALVSRAGVLTVVPLAEAQGAATEPGAPGFGAEVIPLQFVSAAEMKKILDPIVPGAVATVDPAQNQLVVSGTTGQRRSIQNLVRQFDVNWLRGMSFALFVPQNTDSRLIVPELEKLLNSPGAPTAGLVRLIAMERINGILAIARQAELLEDARRWVEVLDREGESAERRLYVYRVQNGRSADLARVLVQAFGGPATSGPGAAPPPGDPRAPDRASLSATNPAPQPTPGAFPALPSQPTAPAGVGGGGLALGGATITSDEANNAILSYATPREYAVIEDGLRKLDVVPLQVSIEAAITEVTLNDQLRYGVQWRFQNNGNDIALSEGAGPVPARLFPGFSYFYSRAGEITAALNALSSLTQVNVLSAPNLLVLNNQTATLQIGDQVPVATQSAVGVTDPDSPIVNAIEYRDTGVILRVTPRVNSSGLVLLDIAQEVSGVQANDVSEIDSPRIQQRRISTSIAVQDGQTVALGGLIREQRSKGRGGVPVLSALPVVGALFGARESGSERTELLILLTPRVVRNADEARAVTDELRDKIRAIAPARPTDRFIP